MMTTPCARKRRPDPGADRATLPVDATLRPRRKSLAYPGVRIPHPTVPRQQRPKGHCHRIIRDLAWAAEAISELEDVGATVFAFCASSATVLALASCEFSDATESSVLMLGADLEPADAAADPRPGPTFPALQGCGRQPGLFFFLPGPAAPWARRPRREHRSYAGHWAGTRADVLSAARTGTWVAAQHWQHPLNGNRSPLKVSESSSAPDAGVR